MTNEDLKRFYAGQGKTPKDFVRLNSSGKIPDDNIPSNVAKLNAQGKIPADNLPSYVDDVIDGYYYDSKFWEDNAHTKEITGEAGKIYLDVSTNKTYRWASTVYVLIGDSFKLYRHQIKFYVQDPDDLDGWTDCLFTFYWDSSSSIPLTASTIGTVFNSFANQSDVGICSVVNTGARLEAKLIGVARLYLGNSNNFTLYIPYFSIFNMEIETKALAISEFDSFTDTVTEV